MGMSTSKPVAGLENRYILNEKRLYLENYGEIRKTNFKYVIGNSISHNFYSHDFFEIRPPYRLNRHFSYILGGFSRIIKKRQLEFFWNIFYFKEHKIPLLLNTNF